MAMLAEARHRQKWSLNPRGAKWANDESKYGQKIMERMGWVKGKGLGRQEQGMTDHLTIKLKHDNKGIGYKGKDDEWIKHYEGFENVLASLNSEENSAGNSKNNSTCNSADNSDKEDAGLKSSSKKSLEAVSKTSKARVHYHKFTRGKDWSRYNADDIGCVLGSKRARILAEVEAEKEAVMKEEEEKEEKGHMEHSDGVTTIKGGNIQEYFAQKMEALEKRLKNDSQISDYRAYDDNIEHELPARPSFCMGLNVYDGRDEVCALPHQEESPDMYTKKKKKKKSFTDVEKRKENLRAGKWEVEMSKSHNKESNYAKPDVHAENETPKKKKKKRKYRECIEEVSDSKDMPGCDSGNMDTKNRKRKKKSTNYSDEGSGCSKELLTNAEDVAKPRKKKKKTEIETSICYVENEGISANDDSAVVKGKNRKKREKDGRENVDDQNFQSNGSSEIDISNEFCHVKSKKCKKKKKHNKVIN